MTEPAQPFGTPDQPRIAVRGEARLEVDPEIARLSLTVTARGKDRRAALEDLTRRNATVLELARTYGDAIEKIETGALSIHPELVQRGRDEKIRAYHGRVYITAVLNDFTALGEFITRVGDLEMTQVNGPWWALRPTSPAHGEARRQAVREAVQRAREYAGALGAELAALVELADIGAENAAPPVAFARTGGYGAPPQAPGAAAGGPPAIDLEPQRQTVYAQVNARFTMTPPKL
ncbi:MULTISPECIES: SIMPL domain-containing protein [unclassified Streptomyces]|uniref:SIMPL domain-containing protein n=1 Tax=unclassified Streptomyces TaxID=2593676 RepID=UPI002E80D8BE|nr:SIMPL domain-containing protein [Streptomyces sp. NBC_00523]WUC99604.1 SIMPL domain-containing protein [Streptomyces sp. NBC_00523]